MPNLFYCFYGHYSLALQIPDIYVCNADIGNGYFFLDMFTNGFISSQYVFSNIHNNHVLLQEPNMYTS